MYVMAGALVVAIALCGWVAHSFRNNRFDHVSGAGVAGDVFMARACVWEQLCLGACCGGSGQGTHSPAYQGGLCS